MTQSSMMFCLEFWRFTMKTTRPNAGAPCVLLVVLYLLLSYSEPATDIEHGLRYIGAQCNTISGAGCNPAQLPMATAIPSAFATSLLLQLNASDLAVDVTSYTESESSVRVDKTASSASQDSSDSFGIKVPNNNLTFSGSFQHKSLVKEMHTDAHTLYYSEVSRRRISFTVTLKQPIELAFNPNFASAIKALPAKTMSPDDENQWIKFYEMYGTHYVKKVFFGGIKRLTTLIDSGVQKDSRMNESDWSAALRAKFDGVFYIPSANTISKEKLQAFTTHCNTPTKLTVGGDLRIDDWEHWTATVDNNPAPIRTLLGPISELFDDDEKADTAVTILKAYFGACPNTPDNGICNGYGSCGFTNKTCNCTSASGSYKDQADKNCYPLCPHNCNNDHDGGTCKKGKCVCKKLILKSSGEVVAGYTGLDCKTKCGGTKEYDAGFTGAWSWSDSKIVDVGVNMPCYCNAFNPLKWSSSEWTGKMEDDSVYKAIDSYGCSGKGIGARVCSWNVVNLCTGIRTYSCTFGNKQCPSEEDDRFFVDAAVRTNLDAAQQRKNTTRQTAQLAGASEIPQNFHRATARLPPPPPPPPR